MPQILKLAKSSGLEMDCQFLVQAGSCIVGGLGSMKTQSRVRVQGLVFSFFFFSFRGVWGGGVGRGDSGFGLNVQKGFWGNVSS